MEYLCVCGCLCTNLRTIIFHFPVVIFFFQRIYSGSYQVQSFPILFYFLKYFKQWNPLMKSIGRRSVGTTGKHRAVLLDPGGEPGTATCSLPSAALGPPEEQLENDWPSPNFHFTGGETKALRGWGLASKPHNQRWAVPGVECSFPHSQSCFYKLLLVIERRSIILISQRSLRVLFEWKGKK